MPWYDMVWYDMMNLKRYMLLAPELTSSKWVSVGTFRSLFSWTLPRGASSWSSFRAKASCKTPCRNCSSFSLVLQMELCRTLWGSWDVAARSNPLQSLSLTLNLRGPSLQRIWCNATSIRRGDPSSDHHAGLANPICMPRTHPVSCMPKLWTCYDLFAGPLVWAWTYQNWAIKVWTRTTAYEAKPQNLNVQLPQNNLFRTGGSYHHRGCHISFCIIFDITMYICIYVYIIYCIHK